MKATTLIDRLHELVAGHGDVEIFTIHVDQPAGDHRHSGERVKLAGAVLVVLPVEPVDPDMDDGSLPRPDRVRRYQVHYGQRSRHPGDKGYVVVDAGPSPSSAAMDHPRVFTTDNKAEAMQKADQLNALYDLARTPIPENSNYP